MSCKNDENDKLMEIANQFAQKPVATNILKNVLRKFVDEELNSIEQKNKKSDNRTSQYLDKGN